MRTEPSSLGPRAWPVLALLGPLLVASCAAGPRRPAAQSAGERTRTGARSAASAAAAPQPRRISAASLPPPFATRSVSNPPRIVARPAGAALHTPPGFAVSKWASGLDNPRYLTVAPNGDVFVAESRANRVTVLRDGNGDGKPEVRSHFATGLRQPFGIAFYPPAAPRYIYIANTDAVLRFPYRSGDLKARGKPETLIHLPGGGYRQHWTRTLAFSPDGKTLYVSVGSRSNVGEESPPRAAIMAYSPDGKNGRVYASGLRNAVGLGISPKTGALWAAVNERDGLGNQVPPDYVTSVKPGFYGWPWYYIGAHHDPRMPSRPELEKKVIVPDVLLPAHSAPLSVTFYRGTAFPAAYRGSAYVGLHGSWNRANPSGYEVVRIPMKPDGTAEGTFVDFVWGWKTPGGQIWGRPVGVAEDRHGALLISDDGGNCIWRVTRRGTG